MSSKKIFGLLSLLLIASMLLAACQPQTIETIKTVEVTKQVVQTQVVQQTSVVQQTQVVEKVVTPTPQPTNRKGGWADSLVFTSQDSAEAAVTQIKAGEIDLYAYQVGNADLYKTVQGDPSLSYSTSFGSYNELTFNPAEFKDGRLNPFTDPKMREAVNWLIDRNYIVQEIFGGLGTAKLFALNSAFPDYARYIDTARKLEAKYAYNPDKAKEIFKTQMEAAGAKLGGDGKWADKDGKPVTLAFLIRTEDKRKQIGDYVANQLESVGFTVDRQYKTRSEASPIWNSGDPTEGKWNLYTGGWITTAISRDDGTNFAYFYTPRYGSTPLAQAEKPSKEFDDVALKLWNNDFKTMEERGKLFAQAMDLSLQDSARVWVIDQFSFTPQRADLQVAYDLAGGVAGSTLWPFTIRLKGQEGGVIRIAQPGILVEPWNPLGGSNWIYDTMVREATQDYGVVNDPYTGLTWPQRIEKADVVVKEGLPMAKTLDWLTLTTAPKVEVPKDAWVDWDAKAQKFITAGEKSPTATIEANVKYTVTYPKDLFTTVKWHDGSPLSVGDFVLPMILSFDPGKADSPIFDDAQKETVDTFLSHFKGVKIVSTDPLVIETYDDFYGLDAEVTVATWWPGYGYGTSPWHNMALGIQAETDKKLAFSSGKADTLKVEWTNFLSGPSLETLKGYLDKDVADGYVPYAPTMGQFVKADEAKARYDNLSKFYAARGHMWLGTGPYYVYKVFPVEKTITLQRFVDFPDPSNKWDRFGTPMVATASLDGPGQVKIGEEAKYTASVTFQNQPYPQDQIASVKYLVFDASGNLLASGDATPASDGTYDVTLTADQTKALQAGSYKLELAVSSKAVSIPAFASLEFVAVAP